MAQLHGMDMQLGLIMLATGSERYGVLLRSGASIYTGVSIEIWGKNDNTQTNGVAITIAELDVAGTTSITEVKAEHKPFDYLQILILAALMIRRYLNQDLR